MTATTDQRITIRLCEEHEVADSWEIEQKCWDPWNWEADGAVGVDYDAELHLLAFNENGELIGTIDAVGFDWDGAASTLPSGGWTAMVLRAREGFETKPMYASAVGASVLKEYRAHGVAEQLLVALRDQALKLGYKGLIAPVRPSSQFRMPHLHISEYAMVRLADNQHFDPWVRTHERVGGRIVGTTENSMVCSAPIESWERWTRMKLPKEGLVLIPGSTGWLDLHEGTGVLAEDSIWVLHEPGSVETVVQARADTAQIEQDVLSEALLAMAA
jgi:GNAT superfamily N-acetyltransferase